MIIAVEGCAHGELEIIYESLAYLEKIQNVKVDVLLCCGDFQATRNLQDLQCMAVPDKYKSMCSFYKYYSGEKTAPVLTIFIGGNHEASNYLGELAYGGWVAPNIYYLGYAGVVTLKGIRIAGFSGIYKGMDYMKGHFEKPPYDQKDMRSAYHIRNLEVFRLKQIAQPLDIVMSHDWPTGIYNHGDVEQLLRFKPFFRKEIDANDLGSKPGEELLFHLKPSYWFSAHLHCKFAALVEHSKEPKKTTRFLALDKCLPRRRYLQILDVPANDELPLELKYDLEWLTILHFTNHLLSVEKCANYMPGPSWPKRWNFTPTQEEMEFVNQKFGNDLTVPRNFVKTVDAYDPNKSVSVSQPRARINPQTMLFCKKLGIDDPYTLLIGDNSDSSPGSSQGLSCSFRAEKSPQSVDDSPSEDYSLVDSFTDNHPRDSQQVSVEAGSEDLKWFVDTSSTSGGGEDKTIFHSKHAAGKKRLSGMSLPPPTNDTLSETSLTSNASLTEYQSPIPERTPTKAVEPEADSPAVSPILKKTFKRRNQALYTSCDDE